MVCHSRYLSTCICHYIRWAFFYIRKKVSTLISAFSPSPSLENILMRLTQLYYLRVNINNANCLKFSLWFLRQAHLWDSLAFSGGLDHYPNFEMQDQACGETPGMLAWKASLFLWKRVFWLLSELLPLEKKKGGKVASCPNPWRKLRCQAPSHFGLRRPEWNKREGSEGSEGINSARELQLLSPKLWNQLGDAKKQHGHAGARTCTHATPPICLAGLIPGPFSYAP